LVLGDLKKAINAQAVKLQINPGDDELIGIYNVTESKAHPINRITTRSGAIDYYASPLIEVSFQATVSKAVVDKLETLNTLDARFNLTKEEFKIVGQNIGGGVPDDTLVEFEATVPNFTKTSAEQGAYVIAVTLRIDNSTWPSG